MKNLEIERHDILATYTANQIASYKEGALKSVVSTTNEKLNAKAGDIVEFLNGFDIPMSTEIVGFDEDGNLLLVWDCYWFPLRQERVTKIINQ